MTDTALVDGEYLIPNLELALLLSSTFWFDDADVDTTWLICAIRPDYVKSKACFSLCDCNGAMYRLRIAISSIYFDY